MNQDNRAPGFVCLKICRGSASKIDVRGMAVNWQIWVRRISCVFCLGIFVFSEYSAAAGTALDRLAPFWERALGWFLLLLPLELVAAATLLFLRGRARLGYRLVVVNLLLYAGFVVVEMSAHHDAAAGKTVWLILGTWAFLFAAAWLSARFMVTEAKSS